jgi:hypothetical protein
MTVLKREWLADREYSDEFNREVSTRFFTVRWTCDDPKDPYVLVPSRPPMCSCERGPVITRHIGLGGDKQYVFDQAIRYDVEGALCPMPEHMELHDQFVEWSVHSKFPHGKPFPVTASVMK